MELRTEALGNCGVNHQAPLNVSTDVAAKANEVYHKALNGCKQKLKRKLNKDLRMNPRNKKSFRGNCVAGLKKKSYTRPKNEDPCTPYGISP